MCRPYVPATTHGASSPQTPPPPAPRAPRTIPPPTPHSCTRQTHRASLCPRLIPQERSRSACNDMVECEHGENTVKEGGQSPYVSYHRTLLKSSTPEPTSSHPPPIPSSKLQDRVCVLRISLT